MLVISVLSWRLQYPLLVVAFVILPLPQVNRGAVGCGEGFAFNARPGDVRRAAEVHGARRASIFTGSLRSIAG